MKKRGNHWKKILLIVACVIAAVFLINQITVYPFIWFFRGAVGLTGQQGNPGDNSAAIAAVAETAHVTVPVNGYPDAVFTVYRPWDMQESLPVIVYIHGGGWSLGNAAGVSWFAKLLASNGYVVCNVDYALAPEHPFPASTCQLAEVAFCGPRRPQLRFENGHRAVTERPACGANGHLIPGCDYNRKVLCCSFQQSI